MHVKILTLKLSSYIYTIIYFTNFINRILVLQERIFDKYCRNVKTVLVKKVHPAKASVHLRALKVN